jgi:hypothetical protein
MPAVSYEIRPSPSSGDDPSGSIYIGPRGPAVHASAKRLKRICSMGLQNLENQCSAWIEHVSSRIRPCGARPAWQWPNSLLPLAINGSRLILKLHALLPWPCRLTHVLLLWPCRPPTALINAGVSAYASTSNAPCLFKQSNIVHFLPQHLLSFPTTTAGILTEMAGSIDSREGSLGRPSGRGRG